MLSKCQFCVLYHTDNIYELFKNIDMYLYNMNDLCINLENILFHNVNRRINK